MPKITRRHPNRWKETRNPFIRGARDWVMFHEPHNPYRDGHLYQSYYMLGYMLSLFKSHPELNRHDTGSPCIRSDNPNVTDPVGLSLCPDCITLIQLGLTTRPALFDEH